jgi:hypothetical protein
VVVDVASASGADRPESLQGSKVLRSPTLSPVEDADGSSAAVGAESTGVSGSIGSGQTGVDAVTTFSATLPVAAESAVLAEPHAIKPNATHDTVHNKAFI